MEDQDFDTLREKIKHWFMTVPIFTYTYGSLFAVFVLFIGGAYILRANYGDEPPSWLFWSFVIVLLLIAGSSGVLGLIRREAASRDPKKPITGGWGEFWSVLGAAFFYVPLIYILFRFLKSLF